MVYENKSFFRKAVPCENGDTFRQCNLSQLLPHTTIGEGVTGLIFINCNLINCDVPGDADIESCNVSQISFCSHLHPEWDMPKCPVECSHVVDTDEIVIDGQVVDVIRHREDTIL